MTSPLTFWQVSISIHALREEGDARGYNVKEHRAEFLSTPSARRATSSECPPACQS